MKSLSYLLLSSLLAIAISACGEDEPSGPSGEPVDSISAQKMVRENIQAASGGLQTSARVMDKSPMFAKTGINESVDYECTDNYNENGDFIGGECSEVVTKIDMGAEIQSASSELQNFLDKYIFAQKNIESSDANRVTYLMRGDVLCADADSQGCAADVDKLQLRLVVTSPAKGDVSFSFLIGPERHNPGSLDLFKDRVAIEADLGGIKKSLTFLAAAFPSYDIQTADLPRVMEGRMRGEFNWSSQTSIQTTLGVKNDIKIEADGAQPLKLNIAKTPKAFAFTVDSASNTITYAIDWKQFDLDLKLDTVRPVQDPINPFDYRDERIKADLKFHTDAFGAQGQWSAVSDLVDFAVNLGSGPAYAQVNTTRVFEAMLNPADGNRFMGSVQLDDVKGILLATAKNALDVNVKLDFAPVADVLKEADMRNSELNQAYSLTADAGTSVELGEKASKVVAGTFSLSDATSTFTASTNQCFAGNSSQGIKSLAVLTCE